jgi:branched-subunit amino acid ABC-type transport system permease component
LIEHRHWTAGDGGLRRQGETAKWAGAKQAATENLADIYIGPLVHGSVSNWFAYVLAVTFLLIRPSGLFGEEQITRV